MIRASKLDVDLYEEVEADKGAMKQAMTVVVLSSVASGIGAIGTIGVSGIVFGTVGGLLGWFIWAFLTYLIGTKLLPEPQTRSDVGELLRTIGFSSSPGILGVLAFLPFLGVAISVVVNVWMLIAMVIATRQALDYESTWRAIGVCMIGFIVYLTVLGILVLI